MQESMDPQTDRPVVPEGYGVPEHRDGLLEWSEVATRLTATKNVWMATTRPDGRPHVVPRWGVWLDERFWYDGAPTTRHSRNIASNPSCVLHLESGDETVILEGTSSPSDPVTGEMADRLAAEFRRKYESHGYAPEPDAWSGEHAGGLMCFTPAKALAWTSFPTDMTRFTFT